MKSLEYHHKDKSIIVNIKQYSRDSKPNKMTMSRSKKYSLLYQSTQSNQGALTLPTIYTIKLPKPKNKEDVILNNNIKLNNSNNYSIEKNYNETKHAFKTKFPFGKRGNKKSIDFNEETSPSQYPILTTLKNSKSEYNINYHSYIKTYRNQSKNEYIFNKNYKNLYV